MNIYSSFIQKPKTLLNWRGDGTTTSLSLNVDGFRKFQYQIRSYDTASASASVNMRINGTTANVPRTYGNFNGTTESNSSVSTGGEQLLLSGNDFSMSNGYIVSNGISPYHITQQFFKPSNYQMRYVWGIYDISPDSSIETLDFSMSDLTAIPSNISIIVWGLENE